MRRPISADPRVPIESGAAPGWPGRWPCDEARRGTGARQRIGGCGWGEVVAARGALTVPGARATLRARTCSSQARRPRPPRVSPAADRRPSMELDFTPEQKKFRDELRAYFKEMMTEELVKELRGDGEGGGPLFRAAMQQMGRDGLLGVGWPEAYGGQGRSPMEQFIFADEVQTAGFPLPFLTLNTVGPTIMHFGSDAQKDFF
ncbi:MAG TPA: hypothetical protein ENO23_00615, partial [Alphaproteobacteria bacterium]|nr:hypothetical protein [Alphaproteobacteria bacterium]